MFNSFRWKLTSAFFIVILVIMTITGIMLTQLFKDYYINDVRSSLINEAKLAAQMTSLYDEHADEKSFLQWVVDTTAANTGSRVTVMDNSGVVLADSIFEAHKMDLHNNRPEVYSALKGQIGNDIRLSETADVEMLYVAIPFNNEKFQGVMRLAKNLDEVQILYHKIIYVLAIGIIISGVVAFILSLFIAQRFAQPVQKLTKAVNDIARGNLKRRIKFKTQGELRILSEAVNDMTDYLEKSMGEISKVKNRLETLLENTINGIIMINTKGQITYANPVAVELLNNPDVIEKKYVEVIKNYELINIVDKVVKNLKPIRAEILVHNNGEKNIEVNVVPIIDEEITENNGILLVLNDITELKRLEQVRRDFVANVSHELKTPVAAISGFAETLMAEENASENIKEFSSIIYEEAQHLSKLISRLLELSRLEFGKSKLLFEDVALSSVINSAINKLKKRYSHSNLNIKVKMRDEDIAVKGDYESISQVLINLLENAKKYSADGEEILIEVMERENDVKVMVTDKGIGIPNNELPRVFERFYRVDTARSRKTGGTGLGLSIVKHIIENHGGTVGASSEIGVGSTFFFILPKKQ
ncbi:MAG: cell wall metabolism sensor histidine kinase WalK [Syntrophomonadaceae bacterium]|nr:cell wall metabolism sensor histidine kinase WalK [Syntrophomonadaceae bacterium]